MFLEEGLKKYSMSCIQRRKPNPRDRPPIPLTTTTAAPISPSYAMTLTNEQSGSCHTARIEHSEQLTNLNAQVAQLSADKTTLQDQLTVEASLSDMLREDLDRVLESLGKVRSEREEVKGELGKVGRGGCREQAVSDAWFLYSSKHIRADKSSYNKRRTRPVLSFERRTRPSKSVSNPWNRFRRLCGRNWIASP